MIVVQKGSSAYLGCVFAGLEETEITYCDARNRSEPQLPQQSELPSARVPLPPQ